MVNEVSVGSILPVTVTNVAEYGIDVEVNGQKGFMQIPELSWDIYGLQKRVSSIVKVGDSIVVKILSNTEEKFYCSLRETSPELNPWHEKNGAVIGEEFDGEVVLTGDAWTLVKLSNFMIARIKPDGFCVGDTIRVKISYIDFDNKKVDGERV